MRSLSLTWLESAKIREGRSMKAFYDGGWTWQDLVRMRPFCHACGPKICTPEIVDRGRIRAGKYRRHSLHSKVVHRRECRFVGIGYGMARHIRTSSFNVRDVNVGERSQCIRKSTSI